MAVTYTNLVVVQIQRSGGLSGGGAGPTTKLINPDLATYTTSSSSPDYVYDVFDLYGNALGTNMTPTKPRRGNVSPGGGLGTGYVNPNGAFQLYDANEATLPPRPGQM
ncbi:MAG: hypothetical protein ABSB42_00520 [Tepidisphaeraceae bacterium]|jgi:hypothetical protein